MKKLHWRALSGFGIALVVALVLVFISLRVSSLSDDLASAPGVGRPGLLVAGCLLYGTTLIAYGLLWRTIMRSLDDARPHLFDSLATFYATWLGRYVPSSLPYVAGKFVLGQRLGHGKAALAASVLYENALIVSIAASTSAVVIPLTLAGTGGKPLLLFGAAIGGAAGLVVLLPPVFQRLLTAVARVLRREALGNAVLSGRDLVNAAATAMVGLLLNGASFALILAAFVDLNVVELIAAGAIFNLAGAAGVAAVPVPSGLGVREAVLIGLLQVFVPVEVAIAAAVVTRLGAIGLDVGFGLASGARLAYLQSQEAKNSAEARSQLDAA